MLTRKQMKGMDEQELVGNGVERIANASAACVMRRIF